MAVWPTVRRWLPAVSMGLCLAGSTACQPAPEAHFAENTPGMGNARPVKKEDLRAGPNVVGINCDVGSCQASCLDGSTILLAYGFHGRAYDSAGPVSPKCGEGVEWLGGCIGKESCGVTTACPSSAMYLICR
jgi:hypothetical protein